MKTTKLFALVAVFGLSVLSAPASAHGDIESTSPKRGATLKEPTDHVLINFTEAPTDNASVQVIDGCGTDLTQDVFVTQRTLHVLLDEGQPGRWQVAYRVISAEDGHKTNGSFNFKVRGQADCGGGEEEPDVDSETIGPDDGSGEQAAPDGGPASDQKSNLPLVAIFVGGLALIGIAALVRLRSGP